MKKPIGWPAELKIKRVGAAGIMGEPCEWGVYRRKEHVAAIYYSTRGWAYAGQDRFAEVIGKAGQGYDGMETMSDALHAFMNRWIAWKEHEAKTDAV